MDETIRYKYSYRSLLNQTQLSIVHAILSNNTSGRGISFHRVMALCGLTGAALFVIVFLIALPDGKELVWDRILSVIVALALSIAGYNKNISTGKYVRCVLLMFYFHSTQVIWSVVWNDFNAFYFLSLFMTVQVYAAAFRSEKETLIYLLYIYVCTIAGLLFISHLNAHEKTLYALVMFVVIALQYLAARIKCRFMRTMRMNQDLLKSLVAKTETAIFLIDINGNILDVNQRAEILFGYRKGELMDRDFKMLRKNDLTEEEIDEGLTALETDNFWNTQTKLIRKDGNEFHVAISITLIRSGGKKFMVYRVEDITSIKEYEAEIITGKDRAEEAAQVKTQFLAVMSHEIRTPLNGVIATASLLHQTDLDTEQEEYINTIRKSGQSLLMLINDILEFSKMEGGKMLLDPHTCNVEEIVFDVAELLRPHAEAKNIRLDVSINAAIPAKLLLDGHRLRQVLINLTGNAIKFTSEGKVEVCLESAEFFHERIKLNFVVKDSGIGIAEDKMHLLFQSFSQVDSSISRKHGGTGLGLVISKQLIELMEGEVSVKSTEGQGTTFFFCIMCKAVTEDMKVEKGIDDVPAVVDFSGMRVLVAEDNEINQQVFRFMLESFRVKADFVENGEEVLNAFQNNEYDLVFMDMQMPVMDGLEATRQIRKSLCRQPVIVAISANSFPEDRQHCTEAGMDDFMSKPFDLDQIRTVLSRWKGNRRDLLISAA